MEGADDKGAPKAKNEILVEDMCKRENADTVRYESSRMARETRLITHSEKLWSLVLFLLL